MLTYQRFVPGSTVLLFIFLISAAYHTDVPARFKLQE